MTSTVSLGEPTSESTETKIQLLLHRCDINTMRASEMTQAQTRPQHARHPSFRLQDFVCNVVSINEPYLSPLHETSSGISDPISHFINYDKFSSSYHAFLASVTHHLKPQYYSQAVQDPN